APHSDPHSFPTRRSSDLHAMLVGTAEEHSDALITLRETDGGVRSSEYANKMIESRPHARWAAGILRRAEAFGVLRPDRTFVDLRSEEHTSELQSLTNLVC